MKKSKQIFPILLMLIVLLCSCSKSQAAQWQEQYDLGVRYLSEGNYEEAIIAFTAAIEIDPNRAEAYARRGDAYIGYGETTENLAVALADYEEAIAIDETNAAAWLGLADVYIRQGEHGKALEVLREALDKTGNDQSIADKLAEMESGSFVDSSGKIRRMEYRDADGTLLWWHDYGYNNAGQRVMAVAFDVFGNQIDQWEGYKYDDQGRTIRSVGYSFDTGKLTVVSESHYEDDYLIESCQFSLDGTPLGSNRYEYDSQGNCKKTIGYSADGTISNYFLHTYDNAGREVRVDYYYADGSAYGYDKRTYDEDGNQIGFYRYDQDGNLTGYTEY